MRSGRPALSARQLGRMRDQRAAATPQALVMLAEVRAVMLRLAVAVAEAAAEALAVPLPEAEVEN